MSPVETLPDARLLRRQMRARRRALRAGAKRAAALRVSRSVMRSPQFLRARRIAAYMAADGELDPSLICQRARRLGKQVFLPVLHPLRPASLVFVPFQEGKRLLPNRFGIPEPASMAGNVRPWQLDLVLMPLVAFDAAGGRLGMGGGFYDRAFSAGRQARWPRRPRLAGLAYRFQQVAELAVNAWDVPVECVFAG